MTNTHHDWTDYDEATREHYRNAAGLLHEMLGAQRSITRADDDGSDRSEWRRAMAWDRYAEQIAWWDAQTPHYDPDAKPF